MVICFAPRTYGLFDLLVRYYCVPHFPIYNGVGVGVDYEYKLIHSITGAAATSTATTTTWINEAGHWSNVSNHVPLNGRNTTDDIEQEAFEQTFAFFIETFISLKRFTTVYKRILMFTSNMSKTTQWRCTRIVMYERWALMGIWNMVTQGWV